MDNITIYNMILKDDIQATIDYNNLEGYNRIENINDQVYLVDLYGNKYPLIHVNEFINSI